MNRQRQLHERVKWTNLERAFESRIATAVISNIEHIEPQRFLDDACRLFVSKVRDILRHHNGLKVNTVLLGKFKKLSKDEEVIETKNFATKNVEILPATNLKNWFVNNVKEPTGNKLQEFQERESGWTLYSIINLEVNINRY